MPPVRTTDINCPAIPFFGGIPFAVQSEPSPAIALGFCLANSGGVSRNGCEAASLTLSEQQSRSIKNGSELTLAV
jgi:hypothetical protein